MLSLQASMRQESPASDEEARHLHELVARLYSINRALMQKPHNSAMKA